MKSSLSRWKILTLEKIRTGWVIWYFIALIKCTVCSSEVATVEDAPRDQHGIHLNFGPLFARHFIERTCSLRAKNEKLKYDCYNYLGLDPLLNEITLECLRTGHSAYVDRNAHKNEWHIIVIPFFYVDSKRVGI